MILTDADQLREALRVALAERDDLRSRLAALQETNASTMRVIAEAQREACAGAAFTAISLHPEPSPRSAFREAVVDAVEAAPLVTDEEKL